MQDDIILSQTKAAGENSSIGMIADSVWINPWLGQVNIDSLRVWNGIADTLYKKPMTWDTRNGMWEYASNWWGGGGGSYTDEEAQDAVGTILVDDNTIDFTYNDGTPSITGAVRTQMSITSDASGIKLVADETTPTDGKFYGKVGGAKGWFTPAGGGITVGTTTITSGTDTRIAFNNAGVYGEDADLQWYTPTNAFSVGASSGNGSIRSYQVPGFYVGLETNTTSNKSGLFRSNTDFFAYYSTATGATHIDATLAGQPINFDIVGTTKMNLNSSGRLFIGSTTSATGLLHLGAGTASASTAPIKFTSGTNLTAAEAGAMEWNGTSLFITQTSGPTRKTIAYTTDFSTYLATGTYTPTLTNTANLDASTAHVCQFMAITDPTTGLAVVTVSGYADVDPTTTLTDTQLSISLPASFSSLFANIQECGGTGNSTTIAGQSAGIRATASGTAVIMQWKTTDITNQPMYFSFTYKVTPP